MTSEMSQQFKLLKNIIQYKETADLQVDLSTIEQIIFKELPEALEKNAPPNFPELYFDFKQEYERFKEFILYEKLIGKNVVALGGGFSSGKSTFLNSLLGQDILPSDIRPSTSVPAYLVYGEKEEVHAVNTFQSRVRMNLEDVMLLAHGFGKNGAEDGEVTLGHLLSSLFISTPLQIFKHIALLDTPGYSKADTVAYSAKTDEKIARTQLNSSNFILWFVPADAGTITESDIKFLKTLKSEIPKLVIVNKADKVFPDEMDEIIDKIKNILNMKGIQVVDVLAYSADEQDDWDKEKIISYITQWDNSVNESRFAYNFKVLFTKCKEYYDAELDAQKRLHYQFSHILADLCCLSDETVDYINTMDRKSVKVILKIKELKKNLKIMQFHFFEEIKKVADIVRIEMPEPSEIDLLADRLTNPTEILRQCYDFDSTENSLRKKTKLFEKSLNNSNPVYDNIYGNKKYKKSITNQLQNLFDKEG